MQTLYDIEKVYESDYGNVPVVPLKENHGLLDVMLLTDETPLGTFGSTSYVPKKLVTDGQSDFDW